MGMFGSIGKALGAAGGGLGAAGGAMAKPLAGAAQGSVAQAGPAAPLAAKIATMKGGAPGVAVGKPGGVATPMAGALGGMATGISAGLGAPGGMTKQKSMRGGKGFRGGKR